MQLFLLPKLHLLIHLLSGTFTSIETGVSLKNLDEFEK